MNLFRQGMSAGIKDFAALTGVRGVKGSVEVLQFILHQNGSTSHQDNRLDTLETIEDTITNIVGDPVRVTLMDARLAERELDFSLVK